MNPLVARLAIAGLIGLAVGIEREWSGHATGPAARFAGVRTFLLIGGTGGIAGWLAASDQAMLAAALAGGMALLVAVAYGIAARVGGAMIDGTTEVAALLVFALGALAGIGEMAVAGGAAAIAVLALSEKDAVRASVAHIDGAELRAALQFAVLALVVLPILPDTAIGPLGGLRLRTLWIVVLIFSGLNFAGYLARRIVGPSRGYGVTGALGGMVSSTAVTLQFSRYSRLSPSFATSLATGVLAASTILLLRVLLVSTVLNADVARALVPLLLPPLLLGAGAVSLLVIRLPEGPHDGEELQELKSPLKLWSAIKMAVAFQLALMAITFVSGRFGTGGVLVSAAMLGLTDMDALTLSMNRLGDQADTVTLAARAIAVGTIANAVLKLALTLVLGDRRFQRIASTGIAALGLAGLATLLLLSL